MSLPHRRHLHPPSAQPPPVLHGRLGRDAFHRADRAVDDRKFSCYKVDQMGMTRDRPYQYSQADLTQGFVPHHCPLRPRSLPRLDSHPLEHSRPHEKNHRLLLHFPRLLRGQHGRKPDFQGRGQTSLR